MRHDLQRFVFCTFSMSNCSFLRFCKPLWYPLVTIRIFSSQQKPFIPYNDWFDIVLYCTSAGLCSSSCKEIPWQRGLLTVQAIALERLSSARIKRIPCAMAQCICMVEKMHPFIGKLSTHKPKPHTQSLQKVISSSSTSNNSPSQVRGPPKGIVRCSCKTRLLLNCLKEDGAHMWAA